MIACRTPGADVHQGTFQMPNFSFVLLYVENPPASASFYADLLGRPIVDSSPTFADWKQRGLPILQEPVQMDFGHTFVAADPDGHRLRVFVPGAA